MVARGYTPAGPVVRVPTGDGSVVSVQRGDGADGPRLFLLLNDRYLGTDWVDPSPLGLSDPVPAGPGRFAAAYGDGNGGSVTVIFEWRGNGFRPDRIAPGHCRTADRC